MEQFAPHASKKEKKKAISNTFKKVERRMLCVLERIVGNRLLKCVDNVVFFFLKDVELLLFPFLF